MNIFFNKLILLSVIMVLLIACQTQKVKQEVKPNIIYILADDLGYGELGVYGQ